MTPQVVTVDAALVRLGVANFEIMMASVRRWIAIMPVVVTAQVVVVDVVLARLGVADDVIIPTIVTAQVVAVNAMLVQLGVVGDVVALSTNWWWHEQEEMAQNFCYCKCKTLVGVIHRIISLEII